MSLSILLSALWVLASTVVAFLPMRLQIVPGSLLMLSAPVLIGFLGYEHGWIAAVAAVAAFLSMYRNPLRYFWRKMRGQAGEAGQ